MKEKKKRAEASAPSARDEVVYRDSRYTLGRRDGRPYLTAAGKTFLLSCHPYAPCLYITDESGCMTTVQNAFDPSAVLECLQNGDTITSITGRRYDAHDFCRMTEYAAGVGEIGIDDAEKVFGCPPSGNAAQRQTEAPPACEKKTPFGKRRYAFGSALLRSRRYAAG